MSEIHVFYSESLMKLVEVLTKEKYNYKVEVSPNGSWNVELLESPEHTKF